MAFIMGAFLKEPGCTLKGRRVLKQQLGDQLHLDHSDETLKRYLDDIRKTAPLPREEEQQLFRLAAQGNEKAREKLISANMRFVLKVAIQYRGCPIPLPDLVSEGAMGLVRAINSFDYSRGLKFISYAVWWIKAYITKAINEQGGLIRLPANQHLRVRKALKDQFHGEEISEDIRELIQLGQGGVSFDAPLKDDSKSTYSEVLPDENAANPETETDIASMVDLARDLLDQLPDREARVIAGVFGINQDAPQTLREVGESLNISHERVRQLRDKALSRIRKQNSKDFLFEKYEGFLAAIN
jgi:RNA polymerase primary sigma factor